MSSGSSASRARSADLSEVLNDSVRTRQTARQTAAKATQAVDARFANIAANVFYQIMGDQIAACLIVVVSSRMLEIWQLKKFLKLKRLKSY